MRDWIIGLEKAAAERKPGVDDGVWRTVEQELQRPAPEELRDLYKQMNGALFTSGVRLYPLQPNGGAESVLSMSSTRDESWAFGERGEGTVLFAIQRGPLTSEPEGAALPEWVERLDVRQWVYGLRREGGEVKFYRSLEQLLGVLVPPAKTEEFGDITYARAINALEGALQGLGSDMDSKENEDIDQLQDDDLDENDETKDELADDEEEVDDEVESEDEALTASDDDEGASNLDQEQDEETDDAEDAAALGEAAVFVTSTERSAPKSKPKPKAKAKAKPKAVKVKAKVKPKPKPKAKAKTKPKAVKGKAKSKQAAKAGRTKRKVQPKVKARSKKPAARKGPARKKPARGSKRRSR